MLLHFPQCQKHAKNTIITALVECDIHLFKYYGKSGKFWNQTFLLLSESQMQVNTLLRALIVNILNWIAVSDKCSLCTDSK